MIAPALVLRDFDHVERGFVNLGAVGSLRIERRVVRGFRGESYDCGENEGEHTVAHIEFAAGGGCSVVWEGDVVEAWERLRRSLNQKHVTVLHSDG